MHHTEFIWQLQEMHDVQRPTADVHKWAGKNLFVGSATVKTLLRDFPRKG